MSATTTADAWADTAVVDAEAIDHPQWFRIAALEPRLRSHVRVQRREARDGVWYLLSDPVSGRFHRVNAAAWAFVGRIDGRHSVGALWQHVHAELGAAAPTQGDVLRLLAQLADAELLAAGSAPEVQVLVRQRRKRERAKRLAGVNPLAFRVPLFDPSAVLNALLPLARWLFTPWGAIAWLALVAGAGIAAAQHSDRLEPALRALDFSPGLLLTLWLAYPLVKLVHEFGHALAVRRWGGEVHEIGVTLMCLTPVPYVDASAATQFGVRRRRIVVGAAGIAVELAIAALAFFVWLAASAPALQQTALAIVLLCGASTLLFNANPLLRFDGYHVLCDLLDEPNLAARANAIWTHMLGRLIGLRDAPLPAAGARHATALAGCALLSAVYRVAIGAAIVVWLHADWPLLALAAAVWLAWTIAGRPALHGLRLLVLSSRLNGRRLRAIGLAGTGAVAVIGALVLVPLPVATVQQAIVWLPEQAVLRAPADGTLRRAHAASGQRVQRGSLVLELENLALHGELATLQARATTIEIRRFQALFNDPALAHRLAEEGQALATQIAHVEQRLRELTVTAGIDGTLVLPRLEERFGHHYAQGAELGVVLPGGAPLIKLALGQTEAARVQAGHRSIEVRLVSDPHRPWPARLLRQTHEATRTLPSAALGSAAGGPIATASTDQSGRTSAEPVLLFDLELDAAATPAAALGQRAWVRFEHPPEPLAAQLAHHLRQVFLRSLGARE